MATTRRASRKIGPLAAIGAAFLAACFPPPFPPAISETPAQKTSLDVAQTAAPTVAPTVVGTPAPGATPRVLKVTLSPASTTLGVKPRTGATPARAATVQLTSNITMEEGATYSTPAWTSSNTSVATVDGTGMVSSSASTGSATIKVKVGAAEATAGITVVDLGGAGVTIQ
ncbi:MAG: Ig-like domain-containing protein [Candidatus Sericytochromatia bacterium]|nr:Ig-like domain-containing protein [Candidatus Tanganyikabacteria bacterium]